jgi:Holliday junction resolvasome RuvABC endonuclease subunit
MTTPTSIYIGIDPGSKEAAIAVLGASTGLCLRKTRLTNWSPADFNNYLVLLQREYNILLVALEKVGVMKGQGISSSGKFMKATGIIIGLLTANKIPFIEVAPQTWKKISPNLACSKCSSTERKKKSLEYAQNRFPEAELTLQIHHNIADALGIADWVYTTKGIR